MNIKTYKGKIDGKGVKLGIIVSRFNSLITRNLLDGALDACEQFGVEGIDVYWVPGSFEVPVVLKNLMDKNEHDGFVVLSAVIRGDTPHFDFVAGELTRGIGRLMTEYGKPVAFGTITSDTLEQALDRAGAKHGNKGRDAVMTVLETISVIKS